MGSYGRRSVLRGAVAAGIVAAAGGASVLRAGRSETQSFPCARDGAPCSPSARSNAFPHGFLWGAATAGHQVEGNNVNSDVWVLEHLPGSLFKEPSADACDHYHLYAQDIHLLSSLGFNTYRFSLEWSRIEPQEGHFSRAALDHYRRMLQTCRELRLNTVLTYCHFTTPLWFARQGGWESAGAADRFARFCEKATRHLGDLIDYALTLNEPNIPQFLEWLPESPGTRFTEQLQANLIEVRKQLHAPAFANIFMGNAQKLREGLMASHDKARAAIKSIRPGMPVGFSLAIMDDQAPAQDSHLEEKRAHVYQPWLDAAKRCDFLGVQTYSRVFVGKRDLPPAHGAELTQNGWEFYPECVEHVVRYAARESGVPVIVTENGIATTNDTRRVEYYHRAVAGLKRAMDDGVDVRGYIAWSLLDNFEWWSGFEPRFGIVGVDFRTQERSVKPSAVVLGSMARAN